jgi:Coenzyme PQQ synthesis protein D (PqqD)
MGIDSMTEKYVARSKAVASRTLGGEIVIMSAVDSTLFILNEVAAQIWLAADGQTSLSEIVKWKVCEEFEVNPEVAYSDAVNFVDDLAVHGILQTSERPLSPNDAGAGETP